MKQQACKRCSGKIADDGDGRIAPIRSTFAGDGQKPVNQARAEIARGVDGVASGAAERETDAPDETAHKPRGNAGCRTIGCNAL